jgi:hypothetical protein
MKMQSTKMEVTGTEIYFKNELFPNLTGIYDRKDKFLQCFKDGEKIEEVDVEATNAFGVMIKFDSFVIRNC